MILASVIIRHKRGLELTRFDATVTDNAKGRERDKEFFFFDGIAKWSRGHKIMREWGRRGEDEEDEGLPCRSPTDGRADVRPTRSITGTSPQNPAPSYQADAGSYSGLEFSIAILLRGDLNR